MNKEYERIQIEVEVKSKRPNGWEFYLAVGSIEEARKRIAGFKKNFDPNFHTPRHAYRIVRIKSVETHEVIEEVSGNE